MQKLNLFVNYFQCGDKKRQKELDFCFNRNKKSGLFDSIINFDNRPSYTDFFNATEDYPNDINIFSNSDIYFNETILLAREMSKRDAYALTRWEEMDGDIVPFETKHNYNKEAKARHSQDVWMFNGTVKGVYGDFHIGRPGCDNRIAFEINRAGYRLTNPSDKIKCVHKHEEVERKYTNPEKVMPPYLWVNPNGVVTPRRRPI